MEELIDHMTAILIPFKRKHLQEWCEEKVSNKADRERVLKGYDHYISKHADIHIYGLYFAKAVNQKKKIYTTEYRADLNKEIVWLKGPTIKKK